MGKMKSRAPEPDSKEPALAIGGLGAVGGLVALLLMRYAGLDPEIAFGVGMVAGPIVTGALIRLKVYSPATVAKLLEARGESGK